MMKVGIIGHRGFVGSAFLNVFSEDKDYEAVGIGRENYEEMKRIKFGLIINANGNSSKILADRDSARDFEMNVVSTFKFLREFQYDNYLHISTVEVYNDKSKSSATKEDIHIDPTLLSNYGFSKYISELIVKKYAKRWLIVRLAGMVGRGMKKGAAYDIIKSGRIFVSKDSEFQYMSTVTVAKISKRLIEKRKFGRIYNIVGKDNISLSKFAEICDIKLSATGHEKHIFNINTQKLENEGIAVPRSIEAVEEFLKDAETQI